MPRTLHLGRERPVHNHHIRPHLGPLQNARYRRVLAMGVFSLAANPAALRRRPRARPRLAPLVALLTVAARGGLRDGYASTAQSRFELPTEADHGTTFACRWCRHGCRRGWGRVIRRRWRRRQGCRAGDGGCRTRTRSGPRRRRPGRRHGRIALARPASPVSTMSRRRWRRRFPSRRRSPSLRLARRSGSSARSTLTILALPRRRGCFLRARRRCRCLFRLFAQRRGRLRRLLFRGRLFLRLVLFRRGPAHAGVLVMRVVAEDRFPVSLGRFFCFERFEKRGRRGWRGWLRGSD